MAPSTTPLRTLRLQRKLTLIEVAQAVKTDPTNLSRTERGMQRSPDLAAVLVKFFATGITEEQILYPERFDPRGRRLPVRGARARGSLRASA